MSAPATVHGLAHVNLRAPRPLLAALRRFYCEVVGLREGPRPPLRSHGYWLYAGDRDVLHLSEAPAEPAPAPEGSGSVGRAHFDHAAFHASGLAATCARLQALGVPFRQATVPESGQVQVFLHDPAGHRVELLFASEQA